MTIGREEAIQRAAQFANANGYLVVPDFEGVVWRGREEDGARPVKFARALPRDGEWSVLFDKMLPPEILSECPGDICVVVSKSGECRFYPML